MFKIQHFEIKKSQVEGVINQEGAILGCVN